MSYQNRFHLFSVLLIVLVLMSSFGNARVSAASSYLSTPTLTVLSTPTGTPTPSVQAGAEPEAWLDGSIDLEQFGPMETLTVHSNTPMSPESSPNPILSWPDVDGVSSWDNTQTRLTFTPSSILDSKKTYTFFLDRALRSVDGKALKNSPEWIVHVQSGPKVQVLAPKPGSLEQRHRVIEVYFDRAMKRADVEGMLAIEPPVPFALKWKSDRALQIVLERPLEPGQRYDLTLRGGSDENALHSGDGTYLAEDYRWFYWQEPFDVKVNLLGARSLAVKFNYALDETKSGLPFTITPALEGKWEWVSTQEIRFIAEEIIPASQEFTLSLTRPLIDSNGFEISNIPTVSFVGLSPVRLANRNIKENDYDNTLIADLDLETFQIEFAYPVDHASAERAFSLMPTIRGKFHWEKVGNGSKEMLVYTLNELLQPGSLYTLKIDSTVLDAQGKKLILHPYEQSFTTHTRGTYLSPSFGEVGENIQIVDANGPRRIQFGGGDDETSFVAYRFDLIDFAKLYADHYHSRQYGTTVRDIPVLSGLEPAATWKNVVTRRVDEGTIVETILPVNLAPGLYVVNLRHKDILYDQLFVVLTRNTLVVKDSGDELFVWLTNINGENVPDAEIRVYSARGEKVREGKTDENGQYRVSIPDEVEPMLVSARVEAPGLSGDMTLTGFNGWNSRLSYDYWDPSYNLPEGQPYLAYLYTERPIYRPGQTVHFKAILRNDDDVRYSLPAEGTPVKLRVLDARGNTIENMELLTNRFGTVHNNFSISEGAMLGHYKIEANIDGIITSQTFQVEDYRKPDYQVTLTPLQP
jgi:alpha-2-macroglobulin